MANPKRSYAHCFGYNMSLKTDMTDVECKMFAAECEKANYYAYSFERDKNGKLHAHAATIFFNARTAWNISNPWKHSVKWGPTMVANNIDHALTVVSLSSQEFITNYMQKDGEMSGFNLPSNFEEIQHLFPDITATKKKSVNPEYERWEKSYLAEERELPATTDSVKQFFYTHFFVEQDLKIEKDPRRLDQRCEMLTMFINKDATLPPAKRFKSAEPAVRFCPDCLAEEKENPSILQYREQKCILHKKYKC